MATASTITAYLTSQSDRQECCLEQVISDWNKGELLSPINTDKWRILIEDSLPDASSADTALVDKRLVGLFGSDQIPRRARWKLLSNTTPRLVEYGDETEYCVKLIRICEAILKIDLELAFVSKQRPAHADFFRGDVAADASLGKWRHGAELRSDDFGIGGGNSVFQDAANGGSMIFLEKAVALLSTLGLDIEPPPELTQDEITAAILRLSNGSGYTALDLAIISGRKEVVRFLLEKAPSLGDEDTLRKLIQQANIKNRKELLEPFLAGSISKKVWKRALTWTLTEFTGEPRKQVTNEHIEMAKSISNETQHEGIFDGSHATTIVGSVQCSKWWHHFKNPITALASEHDLLALAMKHCQLDVVKHLVDCQPRLLLPQSILSSKNFSQLPLNSNAVQDGETETEAKNREAIRDLAVNAMISLLHDDTPRIREIFSKCGVIAKEICFDLSGFPTERQNFDQYADSFTNMTESPQDFESTLAYAKFPDVDDFNNPRQRPAERHEGIQSFLKWLRKNKGVKKIVRLKVLDDWETPYDEESIALWVRIFKIEVLDWRRRDMSIVSLGKTIGDYEAIISCCKAMFGDDNAVFTDGDAGFRKNPVRQIHLYSSDLCVSPEQWMDPGSSAKFDNLEKIIIHSATSRISASRKSKIDQQLESLRGEAPKDFSDKVELQLDKRFWKIAGTGNIGIPPIQHTMPQFPKLKSLLEGYKSLRWTRRAKRRIKVAIIDNGIVTVSPQLNPNHYPERSSLAKALQRGKHISFVEEDSGEKPWWLAEEAHGTWMANLIHAIDPRCDLYIARVCTGKVDDIHFRSVTKAIEWATTQKVDIISMSFALYDTQDDPFEDGKQLVADLKDAVHRADNANIVMVCSTADTGKNTRQTWPAQFDETIAIAGCDFLGNLMPNASDEYADWHVPGRKIDVGQVPLLTNETQIDGSSPATAIAAGLASLTLSCHTYTETDEFDRFHWKKTAVQSRFRSMASHFESKASHSESKTSHAESKYIDFSRFCGKRYLTEKDDVEACIVEHFEEVRVQN